MKLEIARGIANAAEDMGLPLRLIENYSGRKMYGQITAAIEYDDLSQLLLAVADYAATLQHNHQDSVYDEFQSALTNLSEDSLGRSKLIY